MIRHSGLFGLFFVVCILYTAANHFWHLNFYEFLAGLIFVVLGLLGILAIGVVIGAGRAQRAEDLD